MPRFDFTARDRDGKLKNYGYLDMENQADGPATMTFYGDIVATESWPEDRAPQQIADFLASLTQGQQINLYFNSPGGDAYAGVAMHNILSRWQGRKVAYVDAIAASAATMPLMACDEIHLTAGAEVMIHDPWAWTAGNAAELREAAARLDKVGDHYADIYATHAAEGMTRDQLREAMRAETWLDGSNIGQYFDVIVDDTAAGLCVLCTLQGHAARLAEKGRRHQTGPGGRRKRHRQTGGNQHSRRGKSRPGPAEPRTGPAGRSLPLRNLKNKVKEYTMNEEMRKKLAEINATKAEVRQLIADGKLDEAESKKAELDALQRAFNLLLSMEDEDEAAAKAQAKKKQELHDEKQPPLTFARIGQAVVNALGAAVSRRKMDDTDRQIIQDAMKENSDPDGGLTVPQDIQTRIKELRRSDDNLEQYVNVEPVKTMSGSRVIEKEADTTAWPEIDENGEFTEVETPQFAKIAYKITKKGGKMLCSLELLADTAENILAYLMKWIAKKTRATRNAKILACVDKITTGKEVAVADLDSLKDIFNVMLDPAITVSSGVWTNQDGFNWLDKLKDKDGNYVMQPDPTNATRTLLFGKYPVHKLSNKVLKTAVDASKNTNKYPLICGDLSEAITLFDREFMTIESSKEAGSAWDKDQLAVKVRDRFDVQPVDTAAIIKGQITVTVAG